MVTFISSKGTWHATQAEAKAASGPSAPRPSSGGSGGRSNGSSRQTQTPSFVQSAPPQPTVVAPKVTTPSAPAQGFEARYYAQTGQYPGRVSEKTTQKIASTSSGITVGIKDKPVGWTQTVTPSGQVTIRDERGIPQETYYTDNPNKIISEQSQRIQQQSIKQPSIISPQKTISPYIEPKDRIVNVGGREISGQAWLEQALAQQTQRENQLYAQQQARLETPKPAGLWNQFKSTAGLAKQAIPTLLPKTTSSTFSAIKSNPIGFAATSPLVGKAVKGISDIYYSKVTLPKEQQKQYSELFAKQETKRLEGEQTSTIAANRAKLAVLDIKTQEKIDNYAQKMYTKYGDTVEAKENIRAFAESEMTARDVIAVNLEKTFAEKYGTKETVGFEGTEIAKSRASYEGKMAYAGSYFDKPSKFQLRWEAKRLTEIPQEIKERQEMGFKTPTSLAGLELVNKMLGLGAFDKKLAGKTMGERYAEGKAIQEKERREAYLIKNYPTEKSVKSAEQLVKVVKKYGSLWDIEKMDYATRQSILVQKEKAWQETGVYKSIEALPKGISILQPVKGVAKGLFLPLWAGLGTQHKVKSYFYKTPERFPFVVAGGVVLGGAGTTVASISRGTATTGHVAGLILGGIYGGVQVSRIAAAPEGKRALMAGEVITETLIDIAGFKLGAGLGSLGVGYLGAHPKPSYIQEGFVKQQREYNKIIREQMGETAKATTTVEGQVPGTIKEPLKETLWRGWTVRTDLPKQVMKGGKLVDISNPKEFGIFLGEQGQVSVGSYPKNINWNLLNLNVPQIEILKSGKGEIIGARETIYSLTKPTPLETFSSYQSYKEFLHSTGATKAEATLEKVFQINQMIGGGKMPQAQLESKQWETEIKSFKGTKAEVVMKELSGIKKWYQGTFAGMQSTSNPKLVALAKKYGIGDMDPILMKTQYGTELIAQKVAAKINSLGGQKVFISKENPTLIQTKINSKVMNMVDFHSALEPGGYAPSSAFGMQFSATLQTKTFEGKPQKLYTVGEHAMREIFSSSGAGVNAQGKPILTPEAHRLADIPKGWIYGKQAAEYQGLTKETAPLFKGYKEYFTGVYPKSFITPGTSPPLIPRITYSTNLLPATIPSTNLPTTTGFNPPTTSVGWTNVPPPTTPVTGGEWWPSAQTAIGRFFKIIPPVLAAPVPSASVAVKTTPSVGINVFNQLPVPATRSTPQFFLDLTGFKIPPSVPEKVTASPLLLPAPSNLFESFPAAKLSPSSLYIGPSSLFEPSKISAPPSSKYIPYSPSPYPPSIPPYKSSPPPPSEYNYYSSSTSAYSPSSPYYSYYSYSPYSPYSPSPYVPPFPPSGSPYGKRKRYASVWTPRKGYAPSLVGFMMPSVKLKSMPIGKTFSGGEIRFQVEGMSPPKLPNLFGQGTKLPSAGIKFPSLPMPKKAKPIKTTKLKSAKSKVSAPFGFSVSKGNIKKIFGM